MAHQSQTNFREAGRLSENLDVGDHGDFWWTVHDVHAYEFSTKDPQVSPADREWTCPFCNTWLDRDVNAVQNGRSDGN